MGNFKTGDKVVLFKVLDDFTVNHKDQLGKTLNIDSFGCKESTWGQCVTCVDTEEGHYYYYPLNCLKLVTEEETKLETNVSAIEDNLSVAQEAVSNAYMAVQGIIQAQAEKNGGEAPDLEKPFNFSDFDASVKRTWKDQDFKDAVSNAALGLTGEAGEVADLIKKAIYHGRGFNDGSLRVRSIGYDYEHGISPEDVKDELSDVLYYVSATAQEFGFTLEDVAKHNKEKLEKRFPEGFSTEASAQKADRAPEVKPSGVINVKKESFGSEDHLIVTLVGDSSYEWHTFFKTSKKVDEEIESLREGEFVTIEVEHYCTVEFTKVNGLININSIQDLGADYEEEDFKGEGFTLEVISKEVTD